MQEIPTYIQVNGILLILCIPLVAGLIGPNGVYGVRTRLTLGNREIWFRANRFGGVCIGLAALCGMIAGRFALNLQWKVDPVLISLIPQVIALLAIALYLRREGKNSDVRSD